MDEGPRPKDLCEAKGLLSGGLPALWQRGEPGPKLDSTVNRPWTLHIPLPSPGLSFPFCKVSFKSLASMPLTDSHDLRVPGSHIFLMTLPQSLLWARGWATLSAGKGYFSGFPEATLSPEKEPLT